MPDIVVATPGRMIDHLRNSMSVDLDDLSVLILDEADRLLELGFSAEIQELVSVCNPMMQKSLSFHMLFHNFSWHVCWKLMSNAFDCLTGSRVSQKKADHVVFSNHDRGG